MTRLTPARAAAVHLLPLTLLFVASSGSVPTALAQTPPSSLSTSRATVTLEAADALIMAAKARAVEMGLTDSFAVVDENGTLKAFERMEGAGFNTADLAQRKASTAARVRTPTHLLRDRFQNDDPGLLSYALLPNVTFLGGGFPIMQDSALIGGIGVSGGTSAQDMDVAQAALVTLAH